MTDGDGRNDETLAGIEAQTKQFRRRALRVQRLPKDTAFTCDSCGERHICVSAFDAYNTDGDCLEDK